MNGKAIGMLLVMCSAAFATTVIAVLVTSGIVQSFLIGALLTTGAALFALFVAAIFCGSED